LKHRFDGPPKERQLLHDTRLLLKALPDFAECPARQSGGLDDHELVGDFSEDMRGREAMKLLAINALDELPTHSPEDGVRAKLVDQGICIDENGVPRHKVGKGHGDSSRRKSGSRAMRSSVS
jgi:hypothetical protein